MSSALSSRGAGLAVVVGLLLAASGHGHHVSIPHLTSSTTLSGTLNCSQLEQLWEQAGGDLGAAVTAASIAMAESSGQQYAVGPVGERGYWQIAPFNPNSSFDPMTNAKEAVALSGNGQNFDPWTTYRTGAYQGKC